MSGRLRKKESVTASVRRIIRRELKDAQADLRGQGILSDEAVHGARKRMKKARAALRLARTGLGDRRYRRENASLREIARPLTPVRDAKMVVTTLEKLSKRMEGREQATHRRLHAAFMSHRMRTREQFLVRRASLTPVLKAMKTTRQRIDRWPIEKGGWSVLGAGLRRVYKAGRTAFAAVRADPSTENLHEWRKQSKYLWHQLELLEPLSPRAIRALGTRTHDLSDRLGDDHDLAVLRQRLQRRSRTIPGAALKQLLARIDRRRETLQDQAHALGTRVYHEKPRGFEKRIRRYWRAWRSGDGESGRSG